MKSRYGISSYKKAERNPMPVCHMKIYGVKALYHMGKNSKLWKAAYKTRLSFTKRESTLQNEIFIYKTGLLTYKGDSRVAIHLLYGLLSCMGHEKG